MKQHSAKLSSATQRVSSAALLLCLLFAFGVSPSVAQVNPGERININTARTEDLERLPGIGPAFALRIVEHRRKHGPFKRPQDIIAVRGMSARRYRQLAPFIRI